MYTGRWYRAASAIGTTVLAMVAILASLVVLSLTGYTGPVDRIDTLLAMVAGGLVIGFTQVRLYQPRPRRVTSLLWMTYSRLVLACLALIVVATLFEFQPLGTGPVAIAGLVLAAVLPSFFWSLRRPDGLERTLVVGDDPNAMRAVSDQLPVDPLGFVSPGLQRLPSIDAKRAGTSVRRIFDDTTATDGGNVPITESIREPFVPIDGIDRLGGLSRLDSILGEHDVNTIALAFSEPDRGEFFGVLEVARNNGVRVIAHESRASCLLVHERLSDRLVIADVDPWSWYTHVAKRAFDVAFSTVGLVVLAPVIVAVSLAIKLDSPGPVLYEQVRTAAFGGQFRVRKFRTMVPESEDPTPQDDRDNDRITRVGRFLRKTHLDEIPQLWSVLLGKMSVVGPRAVWREEEYLLERDVDRWRKRWHVKPGLTGLAQVSDVTSTAAEKKLELDLEYISKQSLFFDFEIVAMQIWLVIGDIGELVYRRIHHWQS